VLPVLVVVGFYKLMKIPFSTGENTVQRTNELEEKNRNERAKI
jgi:hypothetical protein